MKMNSPVGCAVCKACKLDCGRCFLEKNLEICLVQCNQMRINKCWIPLRLNATTEKWSQYFGCVRLLMELYKRT